MIEINREIYRHWNIGDYLDWALTNHCDEFKEYQEFFKEKEIKISVEPNYIDGGYYWASDNYRLMENPENLSKCRGAKILFYTQPNLKYKFRDINIHSHCTPFAAEPELHRPSNVSKRYDVGIIMQADGERGKFVEKVMEESKMNWLNMSAVRSPWEYSLLLSQCRVLFNASRYGEVNMRFFEGMSIGTLITDKVRDAWHFAQENIHYVGYQKGDVYGTVEILKGLLDDQERIDRIGAESRKNIIKHHTYTHRLKDILQTIKEGIV